jgi:hypothetical protein
VAELLKPGRDKRMSDRERFARTGYEHHRVVLVREQDADAGPAVE